MAVGRGAVAQLAVGVLSHGPEAAVDLQEETVVVEIGPSAFCEHAKGEQGGDEDEDTPRGGKHAQAGKGPGSRSSGKRAAGFTRLARAYEKFWLWFRHRFDKIISRAIKRSMQKFTFLLQYSFCDGFSGGAHKEVW